MKNSLKTFPSLAESRHSLLTHREAIMDWKDAFEAELRQITAALAVAPVDDFDRGRIAALREVLGEEGGQK